MVSTPDPIRRGASITYTISINNNGPADAAGVVITDTFSSELAFKSVLPGSPTCTHPAVPGNQVVCILGQLTANSSKVVRFTATVNTNASNDPVNQVVVSALTQDPNPGDNYAKKITTLDNVLPTIDWLAPVFDTLHYWIGSDVVRLMVNVNDNLGISRVRFYRYDEPTKTRIEIGNKYAPPYEWYLDTQLLNPFWNEIDVEAYDNAGNISTRHYIFIYRLDHNLLYFPSILLK